MALNLLIFNMFEDLSHQKFSAGSIPPKNDSVKRNNIGNNCKIANSVSLINLKLFLLEMMLLLRILYY